MKDIFDIDYSGIGDPMMSLDIHIPTEENFDTLIYFHGGGIVSGDRKESWRISPLVEKGVCIVSAEYHLLPKTKYPEFIEDAAKAVSFTFNHIKEWGGNGRVFISGASAGAYITMMLCMNPAYLNAANIELNQIAGFISESAQMFSHFNLLNAEGIDSRLERIDEKAPIFYIKEGISIPPLLMIYYSEDMSCRKEENLLFYQSIKRFLPANSKIKTLEIAGRHCQPAYDDYSVLVNAYLDFINEIN